MRVEGEAYGPPAVVIILETDLLDHEQVQHIVWARRADSPRRAAHQTSYSNSSHAI